MAPQYHHELIVSYLELSHGSWTSYLLSRNISLLIHVLSSVFYHCITKLFGLEAMLNTNKSASKFKRTQRVNCLLYCISQCFVEAKIMTVKFALTSRLSFLSGSKPLHCSNIHHWLVNTVQRSPFFKDIILTTGGWNFAIWKEGVMVTL